jgi:hypothetical protein
MKRHSHFPTKSLWASHFLERRYAATATGIRCGVWHHRESVCRNTTSGAIFGASLIHHARRRSSETYLDFITVSTGANSQGGAQQRISRDLHLDVLILGICDDSSRNEFSVV